MLKRGDEVIIIRGTLVGETGQIVYARMCNGTDKPEAYSVLLYSRVSRPRPYSGTIFWPDQVALVGSEEAKHAQALLDDIDSACGDELVAAEQILDDLERGGR